MIVGLTGPNASGKGETADYLKLKGFEYRSLSDALREEAKKRSIAPLRENLIALGNRLRKEHGSSCLAERIAGKMEEGHDFVVDSIRNPGEVDMLRKKKGFVLFGITASVETRFKRSLGRQRKGDALTLMDFIKTEENENRNRPDNQQLNRCLNAADFLIKNDGTLKEFYVKIDEALKQARMG